MLRTQNSSKFGTQTEHYAILFVAEKLTSATPPATPYEIRRHWAGPAVKAADALLGHDRGRLVEERARVEARLEEARRFRLRRSRGALSGGRGVLYPLWFVTVCFMFAERGFSIEMLESSEGSVVTGEPATSP